MCGHAAAGLVDDAFFVRVLVASGIRLGELPRLKPEQIENDRIRLKAPQAKTKAPRLVHFGEEMARDLRARVASGRVPNAFRLLQRFKSACKTRGYSSELCLHFLRHTRATRLLESGAGKQVTMTMLGWKRPETTYRYRHVDDDMQREAARKASLRRGERSGKGDVVPFAVDEKTT